MLSFNSSELLEIITPVIRAEVRKSVTEAIGAVIGDRLVGAREGAAIAGVSEATLRKQAQRGTVECVRIGRTLRFRRSTLLAPQGVQ